MLTRIRNASTARHARRCYVPASRIKREIAESSRRRASSPTSTRRRRAAGNARDRRSSTSSGKAPVVRGSSGVSKPGLRVYAEDRRSRGSSAASASSSQHRQGHHDRPSGPQGQLGGEVLALCLVEGSHVTYRKAAHPVPAGVEVTIDGSHVTVTGPQGELHGTLTPDHRRPEDGGMRVERARRRASAQRALHGLTRTLVANMVDRGDGRASRKRSRSSASATAPRKSGESWSSAGLQPPRRHRAARRASPSRWTNPTDSP